MNKQDIIEMLLQHEIYKLEDGRNLYEGDIRELLELLDTCRGCRELGQPLDSESD